jgi:hypothetical protein
VPVLLVLATLVVAWVVRFALARRSLKDFATGDDRLTLAIRQKVTPRGTGWRHGFARLNGDLVEWRAEHKIGAGADLTLDRGLVVREHRPVRKGEAMLSDQCELVSGLYKGEEIQLAVLRTELDKLFAWLGR